MKQLFKSEVNGKELFKKCAMFLFAYIICFAGMLRMAFLENWVGYYLIIILAMVSAFALQFYFVSAQINAISFDDKRVEFTGVFGNFFKICIKGFLLSIITLGIYGAWFEKNLRCYIAENCSYPDKNLVFNGKAPKLFIYILLSFCLPFILILVIVIPMYIRALTGDPNNLIWALVIYIAGILIVSGFYCYYMYKWTIDYTFGDEDITFNATLGRTVGFIIGQMLLVFITIGIYGYAAEVKIFGYIANNTVFTNQTTGISRNVYFRGKTTYGFGLLLGQGILTVITLGIYMPWAFAKIQNWFVSNIEVGEESKPVLSPL